jgi:hypothetical protein
MALFGDKKQDQDSGTEVEVEVGRLNALALPELASEVMVRGFGSECPADDGRPSVRMITDLLVPGGVRLEQGAYQGLNELIGEGMQVLEHAGLVLPTAWGDKGGLYFVATRLGKTALAHNTVDRVIGDRLTRIE